MQAPDVAVSRTQGDLQNPDVATAQTVQAIGRLIQNAALDRLVRAAARDAVEKFRGGPLYASVQIDPWKSTGAQCESVWWWSKHVLKFVHHDGLIQLWFNERDQLQLLIAPDLLLRMGEPRGDCAIYTMLECAMLQALSIPYEIVTAAVDPGQPDVFSHVYPRAILPNGRRLTLDASHGKYPGWEVPKEHIIRKQIWDASGNPIPDEAPRFHGLHDYQARPTAPILPARLTLLPGVPFSGRSRGVGLGAYRRGRRYFRGLGDDVTTLDPSLDTSNIPITNVGGYPGLSPTASAPGTNWGGLLGNLLNQWTGIAGRVIAPTTTIQSGPGGTSISTPAGTPLPTGALLTPSLAGGSGTLLLLLGGGLVLVLLLANKK
jgi:hypothetical protein